MMTFKQKILKKLYPLTALLSRKNASQEMKNITPPVSFYALKAQLSRGPHINFEHLKGKYILIVNTASFCGYTGQYEGLEKLHKQYGHKIAVLGFPANDFGDQEPDDDEKITSFCSINYGVSFPLFKKLPVTGPNKQPVFNWLSDAKQNGWNDTEPSWNFCKYLIDPSGKLCYAFNSGVNPLSDEIVGLLA